MHKNKRLSDYIYTIGNLECKVCLMSIKTGQFMEFIKLCKIIKIICFFLCRQQGRLWNTVAHL